MAQANEAIEVTEENLQQLFYDVRVDHLNEDKLDFKLEIRDIIFDNEESMSRKRRAGR